MTILTDAAELQRRHRAYERGRTFASMLGFLPLVLIYVLTHTTWLREAMPPSKNLQLLLLLVLPVAWFAGVVLLYRWVGPIRHDLRCPGCAAPLVGQALKQVLRSGACGRCGAAVVAAPPGPC